MGRSGKMPRYLAAVLGNKSEPKSGCLTGFRRLRTAGEAESLS